MKISTKGRYALHMLVDLVEHSDGGFISLKEIAERQKISKKYLEQIIPILNVSGILKTNRGSQGGYKLAVSPEKCTVGQILRLTEGGLAPVACLENEPNECPKFENCDTVFIWEGLKKVIADYLDSITIRDIADRKKGIGQDNYVI